MIRLNAKKLNKLITQATTNKNYKPNNIMLVRGDYLSCPQSIGDYVPNGNLKQAQSLLVKSDWLGAVSFLKGKQSYTADIDSLWKEYYICANNGQYMDLQRLNAKIIQVLEQLATNEKVVSAINPTPVGISNIDNIGDKSYQYDCTAWGVSKTIQKEQAPHEIEPNKCENSLENQLIKYTFDNQGQLVEIYDKQLKSNIFVGNISISMSNKLKLPKLKSFCISNQDSSCVAVAHYKSSYGKIIVEYNLANNQRAVQVSIAHNLYKYSQLLCWECYQNNNITQVFGGYNLNSWTQLQDKNQYISTDLCNISQDNMSLAILSNDYFVVNKTHDKTYIFINNQDSNNPKDTKKNNVNVHTLWLESYLDNIKISNVWDMRANINSSVMLVESGLDIEPIVDMDNDGVWAESIFLSCDQKGLYILFAEQYGVPTSTALRIGIKTKKIYEIVNGSMIEYKQKRLSIDAFEEKLLYFEL